VVVLSLSSTKKEGKIEKVKKRRPLIPLSAFIAPEGTRSFLATPFGGLPWKTITGAFEEYLRNSLQGTEVFNFLPQVSTETRELCSRIVGCTPEEIAFVSNATDGLIKLIGCMVMEDLNADDNVITVNNSYPTVPLTVERLRRQGVEIRLCEATTEAIIAAIDKRTRLVTIEACNYVSCELFELGRIAEAAHAVGARIIIDVSQIAGVLPLTLAPFDALVATTYKWLGAESNGAGICWINRKRWPDITPESVGWYSVLPFALPFTGTYQLKPTASRLEAGGLPWRDLTILRDALRHLSQFNQQEVTEHVRGLGDEIIAALDELNLGLTILSPRDAQRRGGYISVRMSDEKAREVCARLNERGIYLSFGQGRLRLGPWLHNGSEDVGLAVQILGDVLREMAYSPDDKAW
jgi:selenocysteine lyase/cysteine desulfurase